MGRSRHKRQGEFSTRGRIFPHDAQNEKIEKGLRELSQGTRVDVQEVGGSSIVLEEKGMSFSKLVSSSSFSYYFLL